MGFFTDSDKKYESQAPANLDENEGFMSNFNFAKTATSIKKSCRADPNDKNYLLCKIKEQKIKNINGEDKVVTEEREEREPLNSSGNFGSFPNFSFPSFFHSKNDNFDDFFPNSFFNIFDEEREKSQKPTFFSIFDHFFQPFLWEEGSKRNESGLRGWRREEEPREEGWQKGGGKREENVRREEREGERGRRREEEEILDL